MVRFLSLSHYSFLSGFHLLKNFEKFIKITIIRFLNIDLKHSNLLNNKTDSTKG